MERLHRTKTAERIELSDGVNLNESDVSNVDDLLTLMEWENKHLKALNETGHVLVTMMKNERIVHQAQVDFPFEGDVDSLFACFYQKKPTAKVIISTEGLVPQVPEAKSDAKDKAFQKTKKEKSKKSFSQRFLLLFERLTKNEPEFTLPEPERVLALNSKPREPKNEPGLEAERKADFETELDAYSWTKREFGLQPEAFHSTPDFSTEEKTKTPLDKVVSQLQNRESSEKLDAKAQLEYLESLRDVLTEALILLKKMTETKSTV